ncbi:ribosome biogenesis GTP-binding protein YihA/YsxC [Beduinella massiliensis]|uniref:ribosome biogenesis GTP-binding protein YihA/YsxC n=1 Tax=Beduinella massiliensis TaxID=1852363 RepID=UPI000C85CB81
MEIKRASFITSMAEYRDYPGIGLVEVALAGKSNVGKSSMINKLCRQNKLARTSSTPGKTRLLNVYTINEALQLIDLPGYGFAKVAKDEKMRWMDMMEGYFADSATLRHVLHLVDIRHDPTADDRDMNAFLRSHDIPFTVIATKADKISRGARMKYIAAICRGLAVQPWEVIAFSSEDGTGREQVLSLLEKIMTEAQAEGLKAVRPEQIQDEPEA